MPKCQLLFLHVFYFAENQNQTESNRDETFWRFFLDQKTPNGPKKFRGSGPRRPQPSMSPQGGLPMPWWVVPSSGPLSTASDAYKFPNIPKTLGESTKHNSSRCKFQNREIQSKHHHRGVHLPHRCLSDDAWVVHHRPTGLYAVARWLLLSLSLMILNTMVSWRSIWCKLLRCVCWDPMNYEIMISFYPWILFESSLISYMHDYL